MITGWKSVLTRDTLVSDSCLECWQHWGSKSGLEIYLVMQRYLHAPFFGFDILTFSTKRATVVSEEDFDRI